MKNAQHIKIRQSEYASLKQELLRLRAQAARQEQAEAKAAALESEKMQLEAEKAVLEQALEEETVSAGPSKGSCSGAASATKRQASTRNN